MKPLVYMNENGIVSLVMPSPKEDIELLLGPLTQEEYEAHVIERSIPAGVSFRALDDADIPNTREFRNAWVDVTPESRIDICCTKAKAVQLEKMRRDRDELIKKEDFNFMVALEKGEDLSRIKSRKQQLRDSTNPLKVLDTAGKVNDEALLDQIRTLGVVV